MSNNNEDVSRSDQLAIVLKYQGALAAESHLADIANTEGDEAVMRIAGNLTAAEVSQVTSEADVVKPSLLYTAINLEQFRGVFRRVGVRWSAAGQEDCAPDTLREFQEELKQFFCAFVLLNENGARRIELMNIILEEQHGIDALVFSVVHEKDFPEYIAADGNQADVGDWREVLGILRNSFPEQWSRFKRTVPAQYDSDVYWNFIHEIAAEIYAAAVAEGAVKQTDVEKADDLFTPLE